MLSMASFTGLLTLRRLQWFFPVAVTIHNTEEAVWLPSWSARHTTAIPWHMPATEFRIAVALLTASAFLVTWQSSRRGKNSIWTYFFVSYVVAMLLNVFVPHIPAALWFHSYVPGLVSAGFVVLPVTALLVVLTLRERVLPNGLVFLLVFGFPFGIAALVCASLVVRLGL
jgi:hypothetical protein